MSPASLISPSERDTALKLLDGLQHDGLYACVFRLPLELEARPVLLAAASALEQPAQASLSRQFIRARRDGQPDDLPIPIRNCPEGFGAGLLLPLHGADRLLGALAVLSREPDFTPAQHERMALAATLLTAVIENRELQVTLQSNARLAQAILAAAERIAELPGPQQIVDLLRETMFTAHISGCAILLYGPQEENAPAAAYDYLEFQGAWSRARGNGGGIGTRIYLRDYHARLETLEQNKLAVFQRITPRVRALFDPLVRGMIRSSSIRSLALFSLRSGARRLGVLVLAADDVDYFSPRELHNYRVLAEFLSMSITAQMLLQQRDRIHQVRAALLDAVSDGILLALPHPQGARVLMTNQVFTSLFGLSEAETAGRTLDEVIARIAVPEDVRWRLHEQWMRLPLRAPDTQQGEFRFVHHSGHTLDVLWTSAPVYQDQRVLGRLFAFHDATADRTAARLRAEFLSRISHELRTPLTSIQGFAEFILEATGDALPDLAREYLQIILTSARQLRTIISDIIDLSRVDAGQIELHREQAHLPDVIIDASAHLELQYKARRQRLRLELDDDLPPVEIDRGRILQVLTNLIANAIKYAPPDSTITVRTRLAHDLDALGPLSPADVVLPAVLVSVEDSGRGLSPEDAERVFMPFFRADDARRQRIEGVGLGLTVARSLVEIHQGKIWIVPAPPASGGSFHFTLPVARESAP